jgi:hypothetical protein
LQKLRGVSNNAGGEHWTVCTLNVLEM